MHLPIYRRSARPRLQGRRQVRATQSHSRIRSRPSLSGRARNRMLIKAYQLDSGWDTEGSMRQRIKRPQQQGKKADNVRSVLVRLSNHRLRQSLSQSNKRKRMHYSAAHTLALHQHVTMQLPSFQKRPRTGSGGRRSARNDSTKCFRSTHSYLMLMRSPSPRLTVQLARKMTSRTLCRTMFQSRRPTSSLKTLKRASKTRIPRTYYGRCLSSLRLLHLTKGYATHH